MSTDLIVVSVSGSRLSLLHSHEQMEEVGGVTLKDNFNNNNFSVSHISEYGNIL